MSIAVYPETVSIVEAADTPEGQASNPWERFLFQVDLVQITSWWWVVGFGVTAVLLLEAVKVRPKEWRWLFIPLAAVTAVMAIGFGVNTQFQAFRAAHPASAACRPRPGCHHNGSPTATVPFR